MRIFPKQWWRVPLLLLLIVLVTYAGRHQLWWAGQLPNIARGLANNRLHDRADVIPLYDHLRFELFLQQIDDESGVDVRLLFVPRVTGETLEAYSVRMARELGVGQGNDRRGLVLVYDVANGRLRLEVGAQMEPVVTDAFAGHLMRAHAGGFFGAGDPSLAARTTLFIVQHRIREAALGREYDPSALSFIADRRRLAVGGGASGGTNGDSAAVFLNKPWTSSHTVRTYFAPQPSPEAAYHRYLEWLAAGGYETDLPLFTPASQRYLSQLTMTRGYNDFVLLMEYGQPNRVDIRGDLAMLFFTDNPLLSPHFFRRTAAGWTVDIVTEILDTRNYSGGWYTWGLLNRGDDFSVVFADRYVDISGTYRVAGGDNRPLPTKTRGVVPAPLTPYPEDSLRHITVEEAARRIGATTGRTLVVLYDTWNERSIAGFPALVATASRCRQAGVEVLAFNTDRSGRGVRQLPSFLAKHEAPFEAVHLIPWSSGRLSSTMTAIGVRVDSMWAPPILAERDGPAGVRMRTEGWHEFHAGADGLAAACEAK